MILKDSSDNHFKLNFTPNFHPGSTNKSSTNFTPDKNMNVKPTMSLYKLRKMSWKKVKNTLRKKKTGEIKSLLIDKLKQKENKLSENRRKERNKNKKKEGKEKKSRQGWQPRPQEIKLNRHHHDYAVFMTSKQ